MQHVLDDASQNIVQLTVIFLRIVTALVLRKAGFNECDLRQLSSKIPVESPDRTYSAGG